MSDDFTTEAPGSAPAKKPGLFSTPTGRVVAILIGLCTVGIIVGIVFAILAPSLLGGKGEPGQTQKPPATAGASQTPTTTVVPKSPAAEIPVSDVFTFRDIFEPLIKTAASTSSSTTTATDTVTPTADNTLYLTGVVAENGEMKAQLSYNGQTYTLGAGESIPNTPWQVLRVSSTSVTMLYGDVQVTLSVGQGIRK